MSAAELVRNVSFSKLLYSLTSFSNQKSYLILILSGLYFQTLKPCSSFLYLKKNNETRNRITWKSYFFQNLIQKGKLSWLWLTAREKSAVILKINQKGFNRNVRIMKIQYKVRAPWTSSCKCLHRCSVALRLRRYWSPGCFIVAFSWSVIIRSGVSHLSLDNTS